MLTIFNKLKFIIALLFCFIIINNSNLSTATGWEVRYNTVMSTADSAVYELIFNDQTIDYILVNGQVYSDFKSIKFRDRTAVNANYLTKMSKVQIYVDNEYYGAFDCELEEAIYRTVNVYIYHYY
mgnify:FL=1